jgi:hypothetical protein
MTETALRTVLRTSRDVVQLLSRHFDFFPLDTATHSNLFHPGEGVTSEIVGKDASGGEFALCEKAGSPTRPLLYVSSEGQAGTIGQSLASGLSTIIDLPYWMDCLKFSGGGQLAEMRRVIPLLEADHQKDAQKLQSSRNTLRVQLTLTQLSDPVRALHSAVTEFSALYPAYASDGSRFGSLFNEFTVMSNAHWRRKLESSK